MGWIVGDEWKRDLRQYVVYVGGRRFVKKFYKFYLLWKKN